MPTGSGVWVAPIGTLPSDDAAWTELPVTKVGYSNADDYGVPQRWIVGADPARDSFIFRDTAINKRSKPMALTKSYHYLNAGGHEAVITVERNNFGREDRTAYVFTGKEKGDGRPSGVYVNAADSIPLALNVLGHDRPDPDERRYPGDPQSLGQSVWDDGHRERLLAQAADNLRAIDLYDQQAAKRKADDQRNAEEAAAVKAAEIAAAKERVKVANREFAERHFRKARDAYKEAVADTHKWGVSTDSTAKLQAALSSYETARRKVEGLPN